MADACGPADSLSAEIMTSTNRPAATESGVAWFRRMYDREMNALGLGTESDEESPMVEPGEGEPFATFTSEELVALCSSGGGIRMRFSTSA